MEHMEKDGGIPASGMAKVLAAAAILAPSSGSETSAPAYAHQRESSVIEAPAHVAAAPELVPADTLDNQISYTLKDTATKKAAASPMQADTVRAEILGAMGAKEATSNAAHVATKETKLVAPAAMEASVARLSLKEVDQTFTKIIETALAKDGNTKLENLVMQQDGDSISFVATLNAPAAFTSFTIIVSGNIVEHGSSLAVANPSIKAPRLIRGKAEEKIMPLLSGICSTFERSISQEKGKPVKGLKIDGGEVSVSF